MGARAPRFHVKNRTLTAIAGTVWLLAGGNVARLGFQAYRSLGRITLVHPLLSLVVFGAFGSMFFRLTQKQAHPAHSQPQPAHPALLVLL